MNREQKTAEIERLKAKFVQSEFVVLTDYKGLTVEEFNKLRRGLKEKNSFIKVVKNRLAKIAIKDSAMDLLAPHFKGTTAVLTTEADPSGPAKVLTEFLKEHEKVVIKSAFMGGKLISQKQVSALADLPSREELICKMLGSLKAPARNWVSVLAQIPRQIVNVLAAVRDQKEKVSG